MMLYRVLSQRKLRNKTGGLPPTLSNRQMVQVAASQATQRQAFIQRESGQQPVQSGAEGQLVYATPAAPVTQKERMAYVMGLLVEKYGYPEAGAAGLVGNLSAESVLLTNRIEGSGVDSPMTATNVQGVKMEFTPDDVMNRKYKVSGPHKPGAGIAQWTTTKRRAGLFQHEYNGVVLGAAILNNLDAQVDYLVKELES